MYVYIHTETHTHIHLLTYTYTYTCTCTYMHIHTHAYMNFPIRNYMHMYTHIHIHRYMYMYIEPAARLPGSQPGQAARTRQPSNRSEANQDGRMDGGEGAREGWSKVGGRRAGEGRMLINPRVGTVLLTREGGWLGQVRMPDGKHRIAEGM